MVRSGPLAAGGKPMEEGILEQMGDAALGVVAGSTRRVPLPRE